MVESLLIFSTVCEATGAAETGATVTGVTATGATATGVTATGVTATGATVDQAQIFSWTTTSYGLAKSIAALWSAIIFLGFKIGTL